MSHRYIKIHAKDNVWVALTDLSAGENLQTGDGILRLVEDIPAKHKFYETSIDKGSPVFMYGILVGHVTKQVRAGERMTVDNLHHATESYAYRNINYQWQPPDISLFANREFMGYHRADGQVGTANYWLFIPTVFCENRNLEVIKEALHNALGYAVTPKYKAFANQLVQAFENGASLDAVNIHSLNTIASNNRILKNIDGIKFLTHQGGCGGTREDAAVLSKLLAAYADHPNVAGITIVSLGCQNLQLSDFRKDIETRNPNFSKPILVYEQQMPLSEEELVSNAIKDTFKALVEANEQTRKPAPLSKLVLGVKCGGSDGFSGISANPAVGYCSDLLVALGGKVLLAEFPELCGVEQSLIDRTIAKEDAEKFIYLMQSYSKAAIDAGSGFHMNPSPGNIKDGLITDAIKSAGAARKGGTSPIVSVLDYTEPATKPGLSLVCTPGNDVEATTGKAASGATLILFTTGLGTPTGNPVCPTIKVSSNTKLFNTMPDIIDINAGQVIDGSKTIEQMGEEILDYCIKAASGEIMPKAVLLNQDDFIPWKRGVSL
ncbi:MAG: altronate dehydratase [Sediminibacterium sp.]|nr:altronate dehydratase [Sediminibacterium sp.]MBX9779037.1 altronate dehydratase family protein [Chitinophagaceae bacterium]